MSWHSLSSTLGCRSLLLALHINTTHGQQAQPPRMALRTDPIFLKKQAQKYVSILHLIQLKSVPLNQFNSPAHLFCLTCGTTSSLSPLSLMGTWLQILHHYFLLRVPVFQTGDSFNISHYLLLATLATVLKGKILKMENRAIQFICLTATPRLAKPTNGTLGPVCAANDHQPKLQEGVWIPSYQSFWLLNQLNQYIKAEAQPTFY